MPGGVSGSRLWPAAEALGGGVAYAGAYAGRGLRSVEGDGTDGGERDGKVGGERDGKFGGESDGSMSGEHDGERAGEYASGENSVERGRVEPGGEPDGGLRRPRAVACPTTSPPVVSGSASSQRRNESLFQSGGVTLA